MMTQNFFFFDSFQSLTIYYPKALVCYFGIDSTLALQNNHTASPSGVLEEKEVEGEDTFEIASCQKLFYVMKS